MKVQIIGKNVTVTQGMTDKIEKKLSELKKYFLIEETTVAKVVVKVYSHEQKIEVTIPTKVALLRAESRHADLYAAIDLVIDKLEDQIRRQKTRLQRKNKEKLALAFLEEDDHYDEEQVVKTKTILLETMDLDDAIMQMEMLSHDFFIYNDEETNQPAVVYRRKDKGYGLIETRK